MLRWLGLCLGLVGILGCESTQKSSSSDGAVFVESANRGDNFSVQEKEATVEARILSELVNQVYQLCRLPIAEHEYVIDYDYLIWHSKNFRSLKAANLVFGTFTVREREEAAQRLKARRDEVAGHFASLNTHERFAFCQSMLQKSMKGDFHLERKVPEAARVLNRLYSQYAVSESTYQDQTIYSGCLKSQFNMRQRDVRKADEACTCMVAELRRNSENGELERFHQGITDGSMNEATMLQSEWFRNLTPTIESCFSSHSASP